MRVVIDTNVRISAFLTRHSYPAQLVEAFRQTYFEAIVSEPLIHELESVLKRPRLMNKYQFNEDAIKEYISLIKEQSIWVSIPGTLQLCRDPRDNFLLETALFGGAAYLVTRDNDIKRDPELMERLAAWGIQVVSVQQFLNQLDRE